MDAFASRLLDWFDQHRRKDLPWQTDRSPYRVWVSEIMLQQTQVATVIPYFEKFIRRFPTIKDLADAELDEVLHHWTGLGYYARGRNLHKAARLITSTLNGEMPQGAQALQSLPGIGRSTAGAIASIAQNLPAPILDGNAKRVLARFHAIPGYPGETATAKVLWQLAQTHTPLNRAAQYTQAIMDLGATLCTRRPDCRHCPLRETCKARNTASVDQYPGRKPKKDKPVRQARLFVVHDSHGRCLLEQRSAEGIWGGLWTPPERPASTSIDEMLAEIDLPPRPLKKHVAPVFRHTFSHFHLDIEPVYLEIDQPSHSVREATRWRWHSPGENESFGLSAPAVRLLSSLEEYILT